ncbi:MAG: CoA transferase [Dehalococcoidia bacterium]
MTRPPPSALAGVRVLDLGGEAGALCGRLLASLGADVILIEPPEGHPHRRRPPFLGNQPGPERSIAFLHYHAGKRGIVLDLNLSVDRERVAGLARSADVVIDGLGLGVLDALGVGYRALEPANPRLIWAAITPYGLDGPLAGYIGTDLTASAAGGFLQAMGYQEDPPFRCGGDQAYAAASHQAAIGLLLALFRRRTTGRGRLVDVSVAESVAAICQFMAVGASVDGSDQGRRPRPGALAPAGDGPFPCIDGTIVAGGGPVPLRHWREFIDWMAAEGIATDWVGDDRWLDPSFRLAHRQEVDRTVRTFYARHTMAELCQGSIERGYMLFPVQDSRLLFDDPQLRARDFFVVVDDLERDVRLENPGPPARLSRTPMRIFRPAPRLGQHTAQVLSEERPTPPPAAPSRPLGLPLSGLRAVVLTWHIAGPLVGKWLADQGAKVIKVESASRPDPGRMVGPYPPEIPPAARTLDMGSWFNSFNSSVQDITLDLTNPAGVRLLRALVAQADVLVENFAPGTLDRWGLDWAGATALRPDLIVLSMPLVGRVGPRSGLSGGGNHLTGLSGLSSICGMEGGDPAPVGPTGIFPDYGPNPLNATIALLAALDFRQRTGEGQHIEIAQFESMVTTTGPALLEFAANGTVQTRMGNRSPSAAPHNVYPCRPDDKPRWCAIAVETDAQWRALADVAGLPNEARYSTAEGRKGAERELDRLITTWTEDRTVEEIVTTLQGVGVPAAPVQDGADLLRDVQLVHRGHFQWLPHPALGVRIPLTRLGFRLTETPVGPVAPAPLLGEHTDAILSGVLGLSDSEIDGLHKSGALR